MKLDTLNANLIKLLHFLTFVFQLKNAVLLIRFIFLGRDYLFETQGIISAYVEHLMLFLMAIYLLLIHLILLNCSLFINDDCDWIELLCFNLFHDVCLWISLCVIF